MKVLVVIFFALISTFHQKKEVDTIEYVFTTDDRHLNANFKKCKEQSLVYILTQKQKDILKEILGGPKEKMNKIYLGLKYPYKTRYYFRTNNEDCFSIERFNDLEFLIMIIDAEGNTFLLYSKNDSLNDILGKL